MYSKANVKRKKPRHLIGHNIFISRLVDWMLTWYTRMYVHKYKYTYVHIHIGFTGHGKSWFRFTDNSNVHILIRLLAAYKFKALILEVCHVS